MSKNMTEAGYLAYCAAWVIVQERRGEDALYIACDVDSANRAVRAGIVFG
jgi:hypothetical protein